MLPAKLVVLITLLMIALHVMELISGIFKMETPAHAFVILDTLTLPILLLILSVFLDSAHILALGCVEELPRHALLAMQETLEL